LLTRALPLVVVLIAAVAFGIYEAGAPGRAQRHRLETYAAAWGRGDFSQMYAMLTPASRQRITETEFRSELEDDADTATVTSLRSTRLVSISGDEARFDFIVRTRAFGTLHEVLELPFAGGGGDTRIRFGPEILFPGLRAHEALKRDAALGPRGTILAADGTPLAQGPSRSSPVPSVASAIVGTLGPIPSDQRAAYAAQGYPPNAQVGQEGLELIFQKQLAGQPGGRLLAGHRVLASRTPTGGRTVRTTIVPRLEQAAIDALGTSYAGLTVLSRTGGIEAAAGIAFSDVQPPGSTMKIVTATAALQAGIVKLTTEFPYQSSVTLDGFTMQNAAGETCGGSLLDAFAASCDTVFAPVGAQLGAKRLVSMAQRFGFDKPTGIPTAIESTIPSAAKIGDSLAVGASAIGQGQVEASTLEMADIGAAIANGGRRPLPRLSADTKPRYVRVTTPKIAHEVQQMMEAVVSFGTGTTAQIPGVTIAGKTGTAELGNTANQANNKKLTDSWFVGYAPAGSSKVVAAALFPGAGYGADAAAPAVKQVLEAALGVT
jgi:cell division protein FtsI/penicillin-binding protein 2